MKKHKKDKITPIDKIKRVSKVSKVKHIEKYAREQEVENKKEKRYKIKQEEMEILEEGKKFSWNVVWSIVRVILFSIVPIILFYLMESYEHKAWEEVRSLAQVYNIILFELIAWILFFLTGSGRVALQIETAIACLYGIVNHYIMEFRSTPFVPWDIFSIKTAVSVADNYDFTPSKEMLLTTGVFVVLFLALGFVKYHFSYKISLRTIPLICLSVVLGVFVGLLQDDDFQTESYLYPFLFTPSHMTKVNGMAVTFAMNLEYVYVEKPDGYSEERAEEILACYQNGESILEDILEEIDSSISEELKRNIFIEDMVNGTISKGNLIEDTKNGIEQNISEDISNKTNSSEDTTKESEVSTLKDIQDKNKLPNIIVIMNEAFSDLSVLGDFTTNEDYMPFLHTLQNGYENTITGNMMVSVCGGNTANSEFEFLTGHTMDFFPMGSIPYQQYIKEETPSMAQQLADLGYVTYGIHPYNASGWNRDTVYPNLGFFKSLFLQDFTNRKYIRNYVSDATAYQKIIDIYEQKDVNTPLFAFEVTMQNHGGYTDLYENFTTDIFVEEFSHPALDQYLSLLKVSDAELQNLISYFEKEEEDTIIVFFGDHQPSDYVVNPILRINGVNTSNMTTEEAQLRYIVPYVIWANFDIAEETNADTDISYLGAKVLETAGIQTNGYQKFLLEMQTILTEIKENGNTEQFSALEGEYKNVHQILQYYLMFDYK